MGTVDTAVHTTIAGGRWQARRPTLVLHMGSFDSGSLVETSLRRDDTWNRLAHSTEPILKAKQIDLDVSINESYDDTPYELKTKGLTRP